MAELFSGTCNGFAIDPEIGVDGSGHARVRWSMEVTEGPHKGKLAKYSGKLNPDNLRYTKRDMLAVGWQGKDVQTFVADVKAAKKVITFTAEIAEYNGSTWTSARIGGVAPLGQMDTDKQRALNRAMADIADDTGGSEQRNSDIPF